MSGSVNKVILIGNLGQNPVTRFTPDGGKIVTLSVATSESWKDKTSGERREYTEWHRIVVFNEKIAEICEKYLKKGSRLYLEGQLKTRKWTDKQGQEKYTTEIVIQQYRGEITLLSSQNQDNDEYKKYDINKSSSDNVMSEPLNDEIPF